MQLHNSLSRSVEKFEPIEAGKVRYYTCGPTVYGYPHIGNMRTYIFADTLYRALKLSGYDIQHVMNITDVGHLTNDSDFGEDKLELGAKKEGVDAWQIAQKYTDVFFEHSKLLNIRTPDVVCKATDHIPEQIALVKSLEDKGYTYRTSDGIYFDTTKDESYGALGRLDKSGLRAGDRVEMGEKKNKTDFSLWKFSPEGQKRAMEWDSPWGVGFPGWHIECSAMGQHFLGDQFDIHTGGVDHIQLHHCNEIAQSECGTGKRPFVKYWLHGEFLVVDEGSETKMSKSLGNILTVQSLLDEGFDPLAYRFFCLQTHYRKQLKFSYESLKAAASGLERLYQQIAPLTPDADQEISMSDMAKTLIKPIFDDLNTSKVLAALWTHLGDASLSKEDKWSLVKAADLALGLDLTNAKQKISFEVDPKLQALLELRCKLREEKKWQEADVVRDQIHAAGYEIADSPDGAKLVKK